MTRPILALLLLLCGAMNLAAQSDREREADSTYNVAVTLINDAKYDAAWEVLERANEQFPEYSVFSFEQGYVRMVQRRYKEAALIFESIVESSDANGRYYSMLGNAYDLSGDSVKAMAAYEAGLKRFPNSGPLFVEIGQMQMRAGDFTEAAETWEKGIVADPDYPSNYFHAARIYLPTTYRGWGILYGEIFMLMELNSERSHQMRDMLYRAYNEGYKHIQGEDSNTFSFEVTFFGDKMKVLSTDSGLYAPFSTFCAMARILNIPIEEPQIISWLHKERTQFLQNWFENEEAANFYNVAIFAYQQRLIDAGLFEAYNHMVFACELTSEEVENWVADHPDEITKLGQWLSENRFDPTANPLCRLTLDMFPFIPDPSINLESAE